MFPVDSWYLVGPLVAVAIVVGLGAAMWCMGLSWTREYDDNEPWPDGLAIFTERDDYGLLCAAAVTEDEQVADDIRGLLRAAGIRATHATGTDGRVAVLVFAEHLDEARRLVGDSPPI